MIPRNTSELRRELSSFARSLRSDYRMGRISAALAANKTKFFDDDIANAVELLTEDYERGPSARALELLGEFYVNLGNNVVARSLFEQCFRTYGKLRVANIIFAEIAATVALVDDEKRILYVALPKCGSSTIKNYFTFAKFGEAYGEFVHFKHPELYRIVTAAELSTKYSDYNKFTVVRDPIKRAVSYFTSNIVNRALRREAHGCDKFMGLATLPGPGAVAHYFYQYRQMFIDFRHHTDPISGYLRDMVPDMTRIYQMSDLPEVRRMLSKAYGCDIPDERAMVTAEGSGMVDLCNQEFAKLKDFYAEDYRQFFKS